MINDYFFDDFTKWIEHCNWSIVSDALLISIFCEQEWFLLFGREKYLEINSYWTQNTNIVFLSWNWHIVMARRGRFLASHYWGQFVRSDGGRGINELELMTFCERLIPIMVKKSFDKLPIATGVVIVPLLRFNSLIDDCFCLLPRTSPTTFY